jgi:hypothetical protein
MRGFVYADRRLVFVVNDRRDPPERGQPNPLEILIRDPRDGLRVVDVDTGSAVEAERTGEGYVVKDRLPPAWYRLYAVLAPDESCADLPPLEPGPAVLDLSAVPDKAKGAVALSWRLSLQDWMGCDVQWYELERTPAGSGTPVLERIHARPLEGWGGLVTSYTDRAAKPGEACRYRIRTVTPLRRAGLWSEAVAVTAATP